MIIDKQKEQYIRLSSSIVETRKARHDLRHHMNAISGFLNADDKAGLRNYLSQYVETLPKSDNLISTGNYIADIIVEHYMSLAKDNGIEVDFNLHIPKNCFIADTDFCVLMGNCLENSIDACLKNKRENRFIRVDSAVTNKYLAITITNSYDGNEQTLNEKFLSDKRERNDVGIGLNSVEAIVKNYNGEFKVKCKDKVFTVYMMLRMLEKHDK